MTRFMRVSPFSEIYVPVVLALALMANQSVEVLAQQTEPRTFIIESDSSEFAFTVAHFGMFDVDGFFQDVSGFVEVDLIREMPLRAEIELRVKSIDTDDESRDENLRSDEFLDAEKFPLIRFESLYVRNLKPAGESGDGAGNYQIAGKITIFGVTKDIQVPFTFEIKEETERAIISIRAEFQLSRKDFNLSFGRFMDAIVGDKISVTVRIVARAQA